VYAARLLCAASQIDANNLDNALAQVGKACEVVQIVAQSRFELAAQNEQPFDVGKFFKDADTKALIAAEVSGAP
jgi:hypothetical protein